MSGVSAGRRSLIVAGGAMLLAAPAAAGMVINPMVASPDADLITLCDGYVRLEKQIDEQITKQAADWRAAGRPKGPHGYGGEDTTVSEALIDEQAGLLDEIIEAEAETLEGIKAKARVLMASVDKGSDGEPFNESDALAWSLALDLVGEG